MERAIREAQIRRDEHYGGSISLSAEWTFREGDGTVVTSVVAIDNPTLTWDAYQGGYVRLDLGWSELMRLHREAGTLIDAYRAAGGTDAIDE